MIVRWTPVVAGALYRGDGRWLMHCRPEGKHHAGLWEFPGGKVEAVEMPVQSLLRELAEELAIVVRADDCIPAGFAESGIGGASDALVILLYTVSAWQGDPQSTEGGSIGWFTPAEAMALPKPPLDIVLARRLFHNL
ncbi:(deoxy)nucleoside triphosphate pyrophosphohydrolase [Erythrobacter sp. R86502]|uniref:(deoxy)nucleoside triphosphate pyrophosphohydrolase n=1 Tax=Erythrobacter sp. R86502 TaxID=3093846 RepID=UPI0036D3A12B